MVQKGMAERIEQAHAAPEKQRHLYQGDEKIDFPKYPGGFRDPGFEFIHDGTGNFSLVQLHPADAQEWENGDGKDNEMPMPPSHWVRLLQRRIPSEGT